MTSFASSPVKQAIEGYVTGRVKSERLVAAVAATYYGETGDENRETLRPLIEVIERAAPGVVELVGKPDGPGFEIRVTARPFPKSYEADLRWAAEKVLATDGNGRVVGPAEPRGRGVLARIFAFLRSFIS